MTAHAATADHATEPLRATMGEERKGWLEQAALFDFVRFAEIQLFEACGWAYDVRRPRQERLDARRAS